MEGAGSDLTLNECVEILCKGKAVCKKPPTSKDGLSVLVALQEKAYKNGLTQGQLVQLVEVAASRKYIDSVSSSIIKCLMPRHKVPAISVINIISLVGTNLLPVSLQVLFLKWLILVYEWIDDKETVHCLYGILFLFLDNDVLAPYVCHLLYKMTKREDVLLFRLKKLQDLLGKVGVQPHFVGLLSLYKTHSPHLVSINIPKTRKAYFKRKDAKWLDIAWNIQSLHVTKSEQVSFSSRNKDSIISLPAAKRRKKDIIIPSFLPHHDGMDNEPSKLTVDQMLSFQEYLEHIDKLEFPSQMATVLGSRYIQHLMVCWRDETALLRLNFWLHETLNEELVTAPSGQTRPRVTKFLNALLGFIAIVKEPIPCLERCLSQYLLSWNGIDYQEEVLLLVSQLHVDSFHKMNVLILEPLRKLFFSSPVQSKCQILSCFIEKLLSLTQCSLVTPVQDSTNSFPAEDQETTWSDVTNMSKIQSMVLLKEFIQFVDRICVVGLQVESDHILLQHWVLCFFEQVSMLRQQYGVHFIQIPSPGIVYRLLFASNSMVISRLCKLIVNYKNEFESLKNVKPSQDEDDSGFPDGLGTIGQFNRYILDISDTLWRNRAFGDREKSLCYSIPRPITDALEIPHINERFSIQNHVALIYLAKKFLVQTQTESLKLNPNLIRGKIRLVYMEFLQRNNLHGIISFLNTFIKQKKTLT